MKRKSLEKCNENCFETLQSCLYKSTSWVFLPVISLHTSIYTNIRLSCVGPLTGCSGTQQPSCPFGEVADDTRWQGTAPTTSQWIGWLYYVDSFFTPKPQVTGVVTDNQQCHFTGRWFTATLQWDCFTNNNHPLVVEPASPYQTPLMAPQTSKWLNGFTTNNSRLPTKHAKKPFSKTSQLSMLIPILSNLLQTGNKHAPSTELKQPD